jgi:hypothetical protein
LRVINAHKRELQVHSTSYTKEATELWFRRFDIAPWSTNNAQVRYGTVDHMQACLAVTVCCSFVSEAVIPLTTVFDFMKNLAQGT